MALWENDYNRLNTTDRENFKKLCNYLMARTYVVRDFYDPKEKRMRIHSDYRFIERHLELFRSYLEFAGWTLHKDNTYGVIQLDSIYGYNRLQLSKFTTLILLTLRLMFEESREEVSLRNEVIIKVNGLVQKMITLNLLDKKPSYKDLTESLKLLAQHNIVSKTAGKWDDPETTLIILPSILFVIPSDRISAIGEALATGEGGRSKAGDGFDGNDVTDGYMDIEDDAFTGEEEDMA